jgi:ferredoxin
MLSTMRSATRGVVSAVRGRPAHARGLSLQNVRHAEPAAAAAAKEITLNLRIGQDVLPIRAQVGKTLLDAAHLNEVNVDGTCDGDLACSTCHVVIGDKAMYTKADAISTGSEEGLYKRELEDDLLLSCVFSSAIDFAAALLPPLPRCLTPRRPSRSSFDVTWGASRLACQVDVTEEMVRPAPQPAPPDSCPISNGAVTRSPTVFRSAP